MVLLNPQKESLTAESPHLTCSATCRVCHSEPHLLTAEGIYILCRHSHRHSSSPKILLHVSH